MLQLISYEARDLHCQLLQLDKEILQYLSSSIKTDFGNSYNSTTLSQLQRVQDTVNTCTDISYRLFAAEDSVTMILFPDGPCQDTGFARREVRVIFLPCPDGFIHVDTEIMHV